MRWRVNSSMVVPTLVDIQAFYKEYEIPADSVARAIAYAIEQPEDVAINEITLRPTKQEF